MLGSLVVAPGSLFPVDEPEARGDLSAWGFAGLGEGQCGAVWPCGHVAVWWLPFPGTRDPSWSLRCGWCFSLTPVF